MASERLPRRRDVLTLLAATGSIAVSAARAAEGAAVGQIAPGFVLPDTAGRVHDLGLIVKANRVVVLNFWATWCGPCIRELPEFDQVYRQLRPLGVAMLGINVKEPESKVLSFARDLDLSFPLLLDITGATQAAYAAGPGLPVTLLLDRQGVVRQRLLGATTGGALMGRVRGLLAA